MDTYSTHMDTPTTPPNSPDVEIGQRVQEALIVKRVTVKALAETLDMSYSTIRRTLEGERSFTISQLSHIADRLNIQPSSLLPDTMAAREAA
ncbi:hypothetical protein DM793_18510 [Paenarthrobacter nitroguajacolicus]|nr:hypothetical protein [Paenarthrobacter nitroguajacolicus]